MIYKRLDKVSVSTQGMRLYNSVVVVESDSSKILYGRDSLGNARQFNRHLGLFEFVKIGTVTKAELAALKIKGKQPAFPPPPTIIHPKKPADDEERHERRFSPSFCRFP